MSINTLTGSHTHTLTGSGSANYEKKECKCRGLRSLPSVAKSTLPPNKLEARSMLLVKSGAEDVVAIVSQFNTSRYYSRLFWRHEKMLFFGS